MVDIFSASTELKSRVEADPVHCLVKLVRQCVSTERNVVQVQWQLTCCQLSALTDWVQKQQRSMLVSLDDPHVICISVGGAASNAAFPQYLVGTSSALLNRLQARPASNLLICQPPVFQAVLKFSTACLHMKQAGQLLELLHCRCHAKHCWGSSKCLGMRACPGIGHLMSKLLEALVVSKASVMSHMPEQIPCIWRCWHQMPPISKGLLLQGHA